MPVIQFKRPDVAAKYEATVEKDITLHTGCYSGKLSGINMCGADHLFASKFYCIKLKEVATNTKPAVAEDQ